MKEVTVITGGAGGMGFATANIFGHKGHAVLLCDVKEEALKNSACYASASATICSSI